MILTLLKCSNHRVIRIAWLPVETYAGTNLRIRWHHAAVIAQITLDDLQLSGTQRLPHTKNSLCGLAVPERHVCPERPQRLLASLGNEWLDGFDDRPRLSLPFFKGWRLHLPRWEVDCAEAQLVTAVVLHKAAPDNWRLGSEHVAAVADLIIGRETCGIDLHIADGDASRVEH